MEKIKQCSFLDILRDGFTAFPNVLTFSMKDLKLDLNDLGMILILLTYLQGDGNRKMEVMEVVEFNDILKKAEKLGIVEIKSTSPPDFTIEPLLIKLEEVSRFEESINKNKNLESLLTKMQGELIKKDEQIKELKEKIREVNQGQAFNNLQPVYKYLENALARPIGRRELEDINRWYTEYNFTPETIILLLEECYNNGKKNILYLNQVAKNWYDKGIKTAIEAETEIRTSKTKYSLYNEIAKYLSLQRLLTVPEMEIVDKWQNEWNFSKEIIFKACDLSVSARQPTLKYIEKILEDWRRRNLHTLQEIEAALATYDSSKSRTINKKDYGRNEKNKGALEKYGRVSK